MIEDKKGAMTLTDVVPAVVTLIVMAMVLGVGVDVLSTVEAGQCLSGYTYNATTGTCMNSSWSHIAGGQSYAFNATHGGVQGLDELGGFQSTFAIVLALAVIIGILGFLYVSQ